MLDKGLVSVPWNDLVDAMLPEFVLDLGPGALVDLGLGECRCNSLVLQIA